MSQLAAESRLQDMTLEGSLVVIRRPHTKETETHGFATEAEARARMLFVAEQLEWFGTPFRDCADIKGKKGGVDCLMLMVRAAVDTKLIEPFDPRPYPPRWMLRRNAEELFMNGVLRMGAVEVEIPRFGDIILWQFGWCFSHGATKINKDEVFHANGSAGICLTSPINEPLLRTIGAGSHEFPRPVKYFDIWGNR